jgi:NTE family protein
LSLEFLARSPLFAGLSAAELDELGSSMRPLSVAPGQHICRAGEPGGSLFVLVDGLAKVVVPDGLGDDRVVAKLRRGDIIGEMALLTGEPRSATVVASLPTEALEFRHEAFAAAIARSPRLLGNLNGILSRKLAATTAQIGGSQSRGEAIAVLAGRRADAVPEVLSAARAAKTGSIALLDASVSLEAALAGLDTALAEHAAVIVTARLGEHGLPAIIDAVDRTVALVADEGELAQLSAALSAGHGARAEVVAIADPDDPGSDPAAAATATTPVLRTLAPRAGVLPPDDVAWLGRHLARTKLGLALGAGGAKGYAHIAVVRALQQAGYTVDYVAGSSIGAIVGAWIALGLDADEIEEAMRRAFREDVVADIFRLSFAGTSSGVETMTALLLEATDEKTFADLLVPLVVMTADLAERRPAPLQEGLLWESLLAATSVAGLFPPFERGPQRLVDGIALVPVPTDAVRDAGADVTVSVNLISRSVLAAWPGEEPAPAEEKGQRARMLDTLLEVMDLAQLDSSERYAALADVSITPRFGPCTWRDFHLADLILEAGREAADEALPTLRTLARPQLSSSPM